MTTILHVDASEFYRKTLSNSFIMNNYNYIQASTIGEALDVLESTKIDIIFTAIEFAYQDSSDFIRTLNESEFKYIPIFVISGSENLEKREELFTLGIVDFISKTTPIEDILKYVKYYTAKDEIVEKMRDLKVAVVDDSKLVLNMVKKILDIHSIRNIDFYLNSEFLANKDQVYDMYLVDFVLKESTGERIVREIRHTNKDAIIIVISSVNHSKTIANVLSAGADDYIVKPFDVDVFMARMRANARLYFLIKELNDKNQILAKLSTDQVLLP